MIRTQDVVTHATFPQEERGMITRLCHDVDCQKVFMVGLESIVPEQKDLNKRPFTCPFCSFKGYFHEFNTAVQKQRMDCVLAHEKFRLFESGELALAWGEAKPKKPKYDPIEYKEKSIGASQECCWCKTKFATTEAANHCHACGQYPHSHESQRKAKR